MPEDGLTRRDLLRRGLLGALGVVAAGEAATACTPDGRTRPASTVPPASAATGRRVDVTSFGAAGDGRTNDRAAIERALASLRSGDTLAFPAGRTFCHDTVISVGTAGVTLAGPGTLRATTESASALKIEADDVTVDGLELGIAATTQRWSAPDQHKLYLGPHARTVVTNVVITGSAAAGLFCDGARDFRLDHVRVSDTRADGIHMTNGSSGGVVQSPSVARSGDDAVAVVSYTSDAADCHDIVVHSPTVRTTTGGRGVSVVGGHDVHYHDIDVDRSSAAAVYLACESGDFTTAATSDASVQGGRITHANTDAATDHGAVLVYSGRAGGSVSAVVVSGLRISDTRPSASRQIGVVADSDADRVGDVVFRDLHLQATPTPYQGNAPVSSFTLTQVTAAGKPVTGRG